MIYLVDYQVPDYKTINLQQAKNFFLGNPILGFDLETRGFFPQNDAVTAAGFSNGNDTIIVPDRLITELKSEIIATTLIGHNLFFDLRFLIHKNIFIQKYWDTLICEKVLTNGKTVKRDLETVIKKYCNISVDKSLQNNIHKSEITNRHFIEYLNNDVQYLIKIKNDQDQALNEKRLKKVFYLIENPFVACLAYSGYHGHQIDVEHLKNITEKRLALVTEYENKMREFILENRIEDFIVYTSENLFESGKENVDINFKSSRQIITLFKAIGIEVNQKNKQTKKVNTTSSYKLIGKQNHPLAKIYGSYGKERKKIETFGLNVLKLIERFSDNRIRTSYNQSVDSGRVSSGGKTFDGIRLINTQNIPKSEEDRIVYIAKPGYQLVISDYSQQEPRTLAEFSKDDLYAKYTLDPELDMHCLFAQFVYPELKELSHKEIIKNHSDKRSIAKGVTFAMAYLGNENTIQENTGLDLNICKEIHDFYYKTFNKIKTYYDWCYEDAIKHGYIRINTVSNRIRYLDNFENYKRLETLINNRDFKIKYYDSKKSQGRFYQDHKLHVSNYFRKQNDYKKQSVNTRIQGTGADMTKLGEIYIYQELVKHDLLNKVFIPNRIHDEIVSEAPNEYADKIKLLQESCMMKAAETFLKVIPMKIETKINPKWLK